MKEYQSIRIEKKDQVATITILVSHQTGQARAKPRLHPELGSAFTELREDNSVRVIVLTGSEGRFHLAPPRDSYNDNRSSVDFNDPANMWETLRGL